MRFGGILRANAHANLSVKGWVRVAEEPPKWHLCCRNCCTQNQHVECLMASSRPLIKRNKSILLLCDLDTPSPSCYSHFFGHQKIAVQTVVCWECWNIHLHWVICFHSFIDFIPWKSRPFNWHLSGTSPFCLTPKKRGWRLASYHCRELTYPNSQKGNPSSQLHLGWG